ncbi:ribosome hibernation-promoting factor, HPF/YfiA family [Brochothrix campestris]|uniref:Ribosome hibernation promoting factor n=1 Tax=Brochothrix campestris FSL F6-1037 TaxID=1265861 RepID=W7CKP8_9LIST|nr:ribosome-associated translation inhibitor RaiA [Brochothrix campestris]EUJ40034.1 ribosomal subunit interface protein [Brochothrix campestris FSL F6-1037]
MLNYNIRAENFEVTEAIRAYVEKKISKLERFFEDAPDANVNVKMKTYTDKTAKVEVTIPLPRLVLRAEEKSEELYGSIDLVSDKLERQLRKHKTKINRRPRSKGADAIKVEVTKVEESEKEFEIVRNKQFQLKPMNSEEAVLQMNMLGHDFFIYNDADSETTNIVYKRRDGKFGLIETE